MFLVNYIVIRNKLNHIVLSFVNHFLIFIKTPNIPRYVSKCVCINYNTHAKCIFDVLFFDAYCELMNFECLKRPLMQCRDIIFSMQNCIYIPKFLCINFVIMQYAVTTRTTMDITIKESFLFRWTASNMQSQIKTGLVECSKKVK